MPWDGPTVFHDALSQYTTFRVGGPAACVMLPRSVDELADAVRRCRASGVRYRVLGRGSNVLFPDTGFDGVVIVTRDVRGLSQAGDGVLAAAGESLPRVMEWAEEHGSASFGFLAGIPGTVGGAITMNAGVPERTIGDAVERVRALGPDGRIVDLPKDACAFAYRASRFASDGFVVLEAQLSLKGPRFDRRVYLARKQERQPLAAASAGCVFRNPTGHSAGALIEQSGMKGFILGKTRVSDKHANFIINLGGAPSAEICKLIDIVRQKVYNNSHVSLDLELEVIDG